MHSQLRFITGKGCRLKLAMVRDAWAEPRKKLNRDSQRAPPHAVRTCHWTCHCLLGTVYDSAPAVLSPRKAHLTLGVQRFHWGSITYTWLTAHVTGLHLHPLKVKQIPCDAPPESYSWTIWWPSPPGKNIDILIRQVIPRAWSHLPITKRAKPDLSGQG